MSNVWQPKKDKGWNSYTTGKITTVRPVLNEDSNKCPKCGGRLIRDWLDLLCINCGWCEIFYFATKKDKIQEGIQDLIYSIFT